MNQALFVSNNSSFISRIRAEGGPQALTTTSMVQALRWITNPEVSLSGIYLNPNDTSFSALHFLEIVVMQRPVTPVYLIDEENEIHSEKQKQYLEVANIKGFFKNSESYCSFTNKLNWVTPPALAAIRKRISAKSEHPGYLAVPIIDFVQSKHYLFDVFVEDSDKKLLLFATAGSPIEPEYLSQVGQKSSWLFISELSVSDVRSGIRKRGANFMSEADFPASWKSAEALYKAKNLLKELQKDGPSDNLVEQTHSILGDIFHVVSELDQSQKLHKLIDQAKESDRNIACAALSILMCKCLKFEKSAIVEILGLASFFQDISLYQSPYGNLSLIKNADFTPEAHQYYQQHPLLSADLLAMHTSVPDVTLQVIRQHHEKKDRTGFPNKIGGMQLHPMAEVLSLINAYLDQPEDSMTLESDVYSHYSDRMVNAFKRLLKTQEHKLAA